MTEILPREERSRAIEQALTAQHSEHYVLTEDGYLVVPVTDVPPEALVYRVDNGRILSELADAAQTRGTTLADIKTYAESAEIQTLLGDLLITQARDPEGPIYDELAHYRHQTEPLLVTRDGLVVNGNRRLAAMQRLLAQDPEAYTDFGRIRAAVLPAAISRDRLEYIEAALQMAPDLKLSYSWINRRLKLRQHVRDFDPERVAQAYRFGDPSEIDAELAQLALAERYLAWIGADEAFKRLADEEKQFIQLHARIAELKANHMAKLWERIGFAMLYAAPALEQPIDHYFPFARPVPAAVVHWVPRAMAAERDLIEPEGFGWVRQVNAALAEELQACIDDPQQADRTARTVVGFTDSLKSNEETYLGPERAVHHLRMARQAMEALGADHIPDRQMRRIQAERAALAQHVNAILGDTEAGKPLSRHREQRLPVVLRWLVRKARLLRYG